MKRLLTALVCLALWLCGCTSETAGKIFRYDIPGPVANLDPQFTADATARMILGNLMEGLVTQSPDGAIRPGVAQSHTLSPDGSAYTIVLREDAAWSNGDPVTAEDFVFAFHRMFEYGSPFAPYFSAVEGAGAILAGEAGVSGLGVRAGTGGTLTIALEMPDPFFLERLCDPAAFPCNRKFFEETRGRYGLEQSSVLCNGPFILDRWDNETRIQLRPNGQYRSEGPVVSGGVNFYIGRDAAEQYLDGRTDLALLSFDRQDELEPSRSDITPIQKTVWCIVFNQNHPVWGNPLLRQGLARTIDHQLMGEALPMGFTPASVLVPDAIRLMGVPYRDTALRESPLAFDTQEGQRLFEMGLAALGRDQLPNNSSIVFPELVASSLNIGALQQGWQKYLGAYLNFTVESPSQIQNRLRSGDYQLLIMPFTPASSDIASLLGAFTSESSQNYFGYHNIIYDELLQSARIQPTAELAAAKYAQAETILLADAVVIPLYFETTYLAVNNTVEDLEVSPFGDRIAFQYARKPN